MKTKSVRLLLPNGLFSTAEFHLSEEDTEFADKINLTLTYVGGTLSKTDDDYFSAMCSIRRELAKENILVKCYGASKNVYPSPLSQSMGHGDLAYKLTLGQQAKREDIVSIFEDGDDVIPVTVDEQADYYRNWLTSLH